MPEAQVFDIGAAARAVARFGLADAPAVETIEVPKEQWGDFLQEIEFHKLSGLAVAAWESHALELSDEQVDDLLTLHQGCMHWVLGLERTLLELAGAFDDAGIELVVLKGPALAYQFYPDPSWRPYADIDLLVRTEDWRKTLKLLADLGLERRLPEPRPGFDERFGKGATHETADGQEIDLHRTLVLGPVGLWLDPEELFEHTVSFWLGGRRLRRLDDTALLVHACVHASLGAQRPGLLPVRDVAQLVAEVVADWDLLAQWTRRWRLGAVVRHALGAASEALGVGWPIQASDVLREKPDARDRRVLEAYITDRRARGGTALTTLRAIPGFRAKLAYATTLVFPSREFLEARVSPNGSPSYLRRWRAPMEWLVRRR